MGTAITILSRRTLLTVPPAAAFAANTCTVSPEPDVELAKLCAQHAVNRDAYNAAPAGLDDAAWYAYCLSCDAVGRAVPRTLAGLIVKARAAKLEATLPSGEIDARGTPAEAWAWDLVNDLLRLLGDESPCQSL